MESKALKYKKGGIAERWVMTTLIPSLIAIVVAVFSVYFSFRQNYYYSAEQALNFRLNETMNNLPSASLSSREKYSWMVELVQSFSERERFLLMLVDKDGKVLLTSAGFTYNSSDNETDFIEAGQSEDGRASFVGYSSTNEHIICVSQMLPFKCGDAVAVRICSSLEGIDKQIGSIVSMAVAVGLILLVIISLTGIIFIRSMVIPLGKIGTTAKLVASGNFNVRIDNEYSGEVAELCDIINDMAGELESSNELKNDFVSSISHEIRTPLTSIKGWSETLNSLGPEDEVIRGKGLEIIINETERLQLMVEDLLDFSKLEAGRTLSLALEDVDLCTELQNSVLTLEQRAKQLGLSVVYSQSSDFLILKADRNKLKQVFTNIFDNAVKYSPRKGTITVSLTSDSESVCVSIIDQGPGIPKDEIDKVTQKYYRASNSVYGTGIGLALVNEILTAHGGRLEIESELGSGTNMKVILPIKKEG